MIIKATKKPETIECVKWDGENIEEIKAFVGSAYIGGENDIDKKLLISTLKGDQLVNVGDYMIKDINEEGQIDDWSKTDFEDWVESMKED